MLSLIPWSYKLGALALVVALVGVSGYVKGRKDVRALWRAEVASYREAAAQAAGAARERERVWKQAMTVAGEKYDARAKVADGNFDTALDRLRNAYSSRDGIRQPAKPPGQCPEPSGPTAAELLRAGEDLAGILRDADRDRAALMACVGAWPR